MAQKVLNAMNSLIDLFQNQHIEMEKISISLRRDVMGKYG